jgi:hypothetical protein
MELDTIRPMKLGTLDGDPGEWPELGLQGAPACRLSRPDPCRSRQDGIGSARRRRGSLHAEIRVSRAARTLSGLVALILTVRQHLGRLGSAIG